MRAGCRFAPRCPVSAEYCLRTEPPLEGDAHRAACIRPAMISGIAADQDLVAPPLRPIAKLPILELEQISVPGGLPEGAGARDLGALAEVSLQIAPGEFVGVVGEHASGKSILAQLVAGSAHPAAGRMMLAGRDITRLDTDTVGFRIGKVQMIFPGPTMALNPHHRIADIVTQFLHQQGARFAVRERRARELLAEVGIPLASAGRRPGQLSLGERLLVGVARAICSGPQLVIADDVLDGLDIPDRARFLMLLHRLRQTHPFALLFVSNDLPAIRHLCDRVLVMHQGTIVEDGLAETVFGWPMHPQTKALLAGVPG